MQPGEEIEAEIDPGKTLVVRLQAVGETQTTARSGLLRVERPAPRSAVPDRKQAAVQAPGKAEPGNPTMLGAPMPGVVAASRSSRAHGQAGDLLLTIEAMKMETGIHAERDATVKAVHVSPGGQIDAKDLLVELD